MNKKLIKKIIIAVVVLIILFAGYSYFFGGSSAAPSTGSSLVTSDGTTATAPSVDSQITADTAFLSTLLGLNTISIDPSLFQSTAFTDLQDNSVPITSDGTVGRVNPFAPVDDTSPVDTSTSLPAIVPTTSSASASSTSPVKTKTP